MQDPNNFYVLFDQSVKNHMLPNLVLPITFSDVVTLPTMIRLLCK